MIDIVDMSETLIEDGATFVVQYGSSLDTPEEANDIDLVAIYPEDTRKSNLQLGDFDITRLSKEEFERYTTLLNPVYSTEPCLTGEAIAGDETLLSEFQAKITEAEPGHRQVNHLLTRSFEALKDCNRAASSGDYGYTVRRLTFAASYWLFASWYLIGRSPCPFSKVREETDNTDILDDIIAAADRDAAGEQLSRQEVLPLLQEWQAFLLTEGFRCEK